MIPNSELFTQCDFNTYIHTVKAYVYRKNVSLSVGIGIHGCFIVVVVDISQSFIGR